MAETDENIKSQYQTKEIKQITDIIEEQQALQNNEQQSQPSTIDQDDYYNILPQNKQNDIKYIQNIILDQNQQAMDLLRQGDMQNSILQFKEIENKLQLQLQLYEKHSKNWKNIKNLLGITYNNMACYYKRDKKVQVALKYLNKALDSEQSAQNSFQSIATTHINFSSLLSQLKKHEQALEHAKNAVQLLKQELSKNQQKNVQNIQTLLIISYQNIGIQHQFLKNLQDSLLNFKIAFNLSKQILGQNDKISKELRQQIENIEQNLHINTQKRDQFKQRRQELFDKGYDIRILNQSRIKELQEKKRKLSQESEIMNYFGHNVYSVTPQLRNRRIKNNNISNNLEENLEAKESRWDDKFHLNNQDQYRSQSVKKENNQKYSRYGRYQRSVTQNDNDNNNYDDSFYKNNISLSCQQQRKRRKQIDSLGQKSNNKIREQKQNNNNNLTMGNGISVSNLQVEDVQLPNKNNKKKNNNSNNNKEIKSILKNNTNHIDQQQQLNCSTLDSTNMGNSCKKQTKKKNNNNLLEQLLKNHDNSNFKNIQYSKNNNNNNNNNNIKLPKLEYRYQQYIQKAQRNQQEHSYSKQVNYPRYDPDSVYI